MTDLRTIIAETPDPADPDSLTLREVLTDWRIALAEKRGPPILKGEDDAFATRMIAAIVERIGAMEPSEAEVAAVVSVICGTDPPDTWEDDARAALKVAAQARVKGEHP